MEDRRYRQHYWRRVLIMAKKAEVVEDVVFVAETVPQEIATDFGREDLNALRDAVNFLIRKA